MKPSRKKKWVNGAYRLAIRKDATQAARQCGDKKRGPWARLILDHLIFR